jgi:hypothetical protein
MLALASKFCASNGCSIHLQQVVAVGKNKLWCGHCGKGYVVARLKHWRHKRENMSSQILRTKDGMCITDKRIQRIELVTREHGHKTHFCNASLIPVATKIGD